MIFIFEDFEEYDYYDYHTASVSGSDAVDINKASNSYAQGMLDKSEEEYYKKNKNRYSRIEQMSPTEYFEACAEGFGVSVNKLKAERNADPKYIEFLKSIITDKKKKFPLPYLDYSVNFSQEGLHRMYALGELFGWNTKFPVQIIDAFDKERARAEKEYAIEGSFFKGVKDALDSNKILQVGVKEFRETFPEVLKREEALEDYPDEWLDNLTLKETEESFIVIFNGNQYQDEYEVYFDDFFGNWRKEDNESDDEYEWPEELDDIDIDDINFDDIDDVMRHIDRR